MDLVGLTSQLPEVEQKRTGGGFAACSLTLTGGATLVENTTFINGTGGAVAVVPTSAAPARAEPACTIAAADTYLTWSVLRTHGSLS